VPFVAVKTSVGGPSADDVLDHAQLRKYRLDQILAMFAGKAFAFSGTAY
jgi:hypothetical protein